VSKTVVVRDENILIPYGVVKIDGCWVEPIQEKLTWHTHIAAGMYVLDRCSIEVVPRGHYDMPQLINKLASRGCVQAVASIVASNGGLTAVVTALTSIFGASAIEWSNPTPSAKSVR